MKGTSRLLSATISRYRRSAEQAGDSEVDESRKPDHQDRPVHYRLKSVFDGTGLLREPVSRNLKLKPAIAPA
ncbi:hypothetical protein KTE49_11035 [Burkholderia multivorans]|uniref:hypothetical protein n=1 Tax=Burkholderia multivorans TaxID=87883 RepID=UPI000CFEF9F1|nr:hypothetical protein [Burkholderia multivorans]MBJ9618518.1 hypothetical protein [Burkholderia multivorans]MBU9327648.1 hypothetical protein [Burkholderia multivorans]MBU9530981.1 hypothetical protein [Burkholderia multivorans]PRF13231.1 hypothetical protein C6Q01_06365 [Burkholderia multivorans]PRF94914.1 hypothetical protein C6Q23_01505 [Burkholderia multivorans]